MLNQWKRPLNGSTNLRSTIGPVDPNSDANPPTTRRISKLKDLCLHPIQAMEVLDLRTVWLLSEVANARWKTPRRLLTETEPNLHRMQILNRDIIVHAGRERQIRWRWLALKNPSRPRTDPPFLPQIHQKITSLFQHPLSVTQTTGTSQSCCPNIHFNGDLRSFNL
jgi:hypothetical protein